MLCRVDEAVIGFLVIFLVYGVFGLVCALLAPGRGRSPVAWFFIGVATQCLGIILILLLPNLKLEEDKRRRQQAETRRLREQLKKERQVADQRHVANRERLEVHDRALGVDTSPADQKLIDAGMAPPPLPSAASGEEEQWYYAIAGERDGPVPESMLRDLFQRGGIDTSTLVWREGMDDWVRLGDIPQILTGEEDES